MEHTGASLAPVRQITAAVVACGLAAPAAVAEVGRVRIGEAEVAFETLGRSGPVVVFESGRGEDMRSWEHVARPLAACARVVLYDRPGIGRSSPRTGGSVLHILVGHSLGGFYAQAFARKRPAEVAAVVLVDAASPFEPPGVFVSTVPPKPGSLEAAEEAGFAPSVRAMLAGPPFPAVPLIVLAATNHGDTPEREALWRETQARTAALSPKGQLRIVDGSGHFIQIDRPQAVVDAVVEALRQTGADVSACKTTNPVR